MTIADDSDALLSEAFKHIESGAYPAPRVGEIWVRDGSDKQVVAVNVWQLMRAMLIGRAYAMSPTGQKTHVGHDAWCQQMGRYLRWHGFWVVPHERVAALGAERAIPDLSEARLADPNAYVRSVRHEMASALVSVILQTGLMDWDKRKNDDLGAPIGAVNMIGRLLVIHPQTGCGPIVHKSESDNG